MQQEGLAIAWTDTCSLATASVSPKAPTFGAQLHANGVMQYLYSRPCGYAGGRVMPYAMKPSNSQTPLPIVYTLYSNLMFSI
jgi:hypothetical protein